MRRGIEGESRKNKGEETDVVDRMNHIFKRERKSGKEERKRDRCARGKGSYIYI